MCRTYGRKHAIVEHVGQKREANLAKETKVSLKRMGENSHFKKTLQTKQRKKTFKND